MDIFNNAKVLLIDDSKLSRAVIKNTLSELNMKITECCDGNEGLIALKKDRFDIILVDTVMPVMDGITFLKEIKSNEEDDFIPAILMTGNDDLNSKIKGLNIGADDFLQKPVNQKELVARVMSLLRLKRTHDQLYIRNKLIEKELIAAKKVQQFIIPHNFDYISYPRISGKYLPMEDIGGDFYDAYPLANGNVGLLIADVTGHGIPAALIVTMTKMIFSIYADKFTSTAELLSKVNDEIRNMLIEGQYITAFYGIYDKEKEIFRFTNAGHSRPLLLRKKTGKVHLLDTSGFFIGILDDPGYDEKAVRIEKGDILFLFTDGITELKNTEKVEFGEKRLAKFISENNNYKGDEFCEKLLESLIKFSYKAERNDDISLLYIEF
ncbi:MAG: SpoIIE family protein phosphatase [Spirochaetota bacterium]